MTDIYFVFKCEKATLLDGNEIVLRTLRAILAKNNGIDLIATNVTNEGVPMVDEYAVRIPRATVLDYTLIKSAQQEYPISHLKLLRN